MGFRDKVRAEAKRAFRGLEIDDAPAGPVVLRSLLKLSEEEQNEFFELQKRLLDLESQTGASMADIRVNLIRMTEVLADKPEGLAEYLEDFDTAELIALYRLWARETQATESKSRK